MPSFFTFITYGGIFLAAEVLAIFIAWSLCRAAKRGDQYMEGASE